MNKLKKKPLPLPVGKRRRYTEQQRIEALTLLRENSYNYGKTSLDTGIPYATIKVWYSKYKNEMNEMSAVSCIAEKVEQNLARIKTDFVTAHFKTMSTLASAAIDRALVLIANEVDLNKINNTIKIATEFFTKIGEVDPASAKGETHISIIRQTINNLNSGREE